MEVIPLMTPSLYMFVSSRSCVQLPGVLHAGRWRAVRGLGVGGHGFRLLLPARQPGSHLGHQPPGSERPNSAAAPRGEVPATLRGLRVSKGGGGSQRARVCTGRLCCCCLVLKLFRFLVWDKWSTPFKKNNNWIICYSWNKMPKLVGLIGFLWFMSDKNHHLNQGWK